MKKITLAFDVYATLIDTNGLIAKLQGLMEGKAAAFSQTWRDKQLEYSFRRGLMQNYRAFSVCTAQALDYSCAFHKVTLTENQRKELLAGYRTLPAFDDVTSGFSRLKGEGFGLYAFSNGVEEDLESLLKGAGIRNLLDGVVSVHPMRSFKPDPSVYSHFLRSAGATGEAAWLISSNPFDVIGAVSAGMNSAWIPRSPDAIFDPWEIEPTLTVESLNTLGDEIKRFYNLTSPRG